MLRHIHLSLLGLVAAGGALGVFARAALTGAETTTGTVPWLTLLINASGTLLLGVLVGWLGQRRARLQAFLGTGVLGGFTTYSALAVQTATWLAMAPWTAAALAVGSLVAGILSAMVGLIIGSRIAETHSRREGAENAQ